MESDVAEETNLHVQGRRAATLKTEVIVSYQTLVIHLPDYTVWRLQLQEPPL